MRREVMDRIERHLDEKLGFWTRLLPWRRELALHMEEAYERAQADKEASESSFDEDVWKRVLSDFGDVEDVAVQMRREHWPQYAGLRAVAVFLSAWMVYQITGVVSEIYFSPRASIFVLGPALAALVLDGYQGSTRWDRARRAGTWGALCGALFGAALMFAKIDDPSECGVGLAMSLLSALYGILLFTPRRRLIMALVAVVLLDMLMLAATFDNSPSFEGFLFGPWQSIHGRFILRALGICCAGLIAGTARFGFHGLPNHALSVGVGTFFVCLVILLVHFDSPDALGPGLVIALGAMFLSVMASYGIWMTSRLVRRRIA